MIDHVLVKIPWNQTCSIIFQGCSFDLMYHCVVKICNKEPSHFSMVSSMSKPLAWSEGIGYCDDRHVSKPILVIFASLLARDLTHLTLCFIPSIVENMPGKRVLNRPRKHRLDLTRCLHKNLPFFRVHKPLPIRTYRLHHVDSMWAAMRAMSCVDVSRNWWYPMENPNHKWRF